MRLVKNQKNLHFLVTIIVIFMISSLYSFAQGTAPSQEEMWRMIQQQQKEIQSLKQKLNMVEKDVSTTEERVEMIADMPSMGGAPSWADKTTVGGYGELHYNNLSNKGTSGRVDDKDQIDFHRFVLFFGHEFSDRIRFFSEFELEHSIAGEGKNGEVELEQAYVDMDLNDYHTLRAGQFLIPIGILNETHEPPTFYGVERNEVEKNIIPATWWEGGIALTGQLVPDIGLSYDIAYTSGLSVPDSAAAKNNFTIRSGRTKVSEAIAESGAYTGRIKLNQPGLELATTFHYETDLAQASAVDPNASALLWEIHTIVEKGPFGLRALYAQWDIDSRAFETAGADKQFGWYLEPSLKLGEHFGIFARYSEYDKKDGDSVDSEIEQFDIGLNWWPTENVVFKIDYQDQDTPKGSTKELDGINLGFGYNF